MNNVKLGLEHKNSDLDNLIHKVCSQETFIDSTTSITWYTWLIKNYKHVHWSSSVLMSSKTSKNMSQRFGFTQHWKPNTEKREKNPLVTNVINLNLHRYWAKKHANETMLNRKTKKTKDMTELNILTHIFKLMSSNSLSKVQTKMRTGSCNVMPERLINFKITVIMSNWESCGC